MDSDENCSLRGVKSTYLGNKHEPKLFISGEQRAHKPKARKQHYRDRYLDTLCNCNLTNLNSAQTRSIMTVSRKDDGNQQG